MYDNHIVASMIEKQILIDDLNNICQQTNAQWLCALDAFTSNIKEDENKFCKVFQEAGLTKKDLLATKQVSLEYGGGLRFNYNDIVSGGHIINVKEQYVAPLVFSGFDTHYDQLTIYHECAHLYQRKYGFFNKSTVPDTKYRKYLKEVHANTFATMVLLLRSKDVLSFKKQRQSCIAQNIKTFNQNTENSKYYISLPIVLNLLKAIRRQGRANTLRQFSKKGQLDFEKIAFFTADFVRRYAYTSNEFYQILNDGTVASYEALKQKTKASKVLGENYLIEERKKMHKRKADYEQIGEIRRTKTDKKIKKLPEVDEKAKVLNVVCAIDVLHTRLNQDFEIYADLDNLISKKYYCLSDISDSAKKQEALKICDEMAQIHQQWRKNPYYKKLFLKVSHPDTRDEVWNLKFKREKEILQTFQASKQY